MSLRDDNNAIVTSIFNCSTVMAMVLRFRDIPQKVNDPLTDWETSVMHNLQVLDACDNYLSPVLWSRDTLFHFYVLLESLTSNLYERDRLLNLLSTACLASVSLQNSSKS